MRALPFFVCALAACAPEHSVLGRGYGLQVPTGADATTPLPLVILAHGYGVNGVGQDIFFPISKQVDAKQYLYALPNGTMDKLGRRFWNATDFCCNFDDVKVDDVAFFRALIDDVKAQHPVSKVYMVGHSNGAFMTLRLACEASDVIDGVIAVSGAAWDDFSRCPDGRKIPILLVHGTSDGTIHYEGVEGKYPSAHETGRRFAARAGCGGAWVDAGRGDYVNDAVEETHKEVVEGCTPAVELWSLEGTGHLPIFDQRWTTAAFDWLQGHAR
jgi:polyhydroxybutyrate depolymerase